MSRRMRNRCQDNAKPMSRRMRSPCQDECEADVEIMRSRCQDECEAAVNSNAKPMSRRMRSRWQDECDECEANVKILRSRCQGECEADVKNALTGRYLHTQTCTRNASAVTNKLTSDWNTQTDKFVSMSALLTSLPPRSWLDGNFYNKRRFPFHCQDRLLKN